MKSKLLIKTIALLLLVSMIIPTVVACSKDEQSETETTESTVTTEVEGYPYFNGTVLGGATYKILNCNADMWGMLCYVTSHDMTGDEINDEVYKRTLWIEEQLNCKLEEVYMDIYALDDELRIDATSGSGAYAAAYVRSYDTLAGIIDGTLGRLDDISTLHFEEDYWDAGIMSASSLGNRNYTAASDAHLMSFEGTWCIFFNSGMLEAHGIESPYDMVRNGTWTLEKLKEISKIVSTPNNDGSFTWNDHGEAVYGYTSFRTGISKLLYGIGAQYGKKNVNDIPYLTCENESFYNRAQDLAEFTSDQDAYLYSKGDGGSAGEFSYLKVFMNQRAAFVGAEIQQGAKFRNASFEYGILPYPKYDTDQTEYMSSGLDYDLALLTIPSAYVNKEDIGLIMDALSWDANRTFEEIYYERRLSYRNNVGQMADNIEMLNLIRRTRTYDPMVITGLSGELWERVIYSIADGGDDIVSVVEKYKGYPEKQTAKLQAMFKNQ